MLHLLWCILGYDIWSLYLPAIIYVCGLDPKSVVEFGLQMIYQYIWHKSRSSV